VSDKKTEISLSAPYADSPIASGRTRVMLADDHEIVLDMLIRLLKPEFEVVGTVTNGTDVLGTAQRLRPDIILIDVVMPGMSGLEAGRRLRAWAPDIKLVYLSMEGDEVSAAEAFAVGASGYLSKACSAAELQEAMRIVAAGGRYLMPTIANGDVDALHEAHRESPVAKLSPRELEVLKLLVSGLSMKVVGRRLGITPRTVAFHKYHAMEALGLHGNTELIEFAIRHGLLGASGGTVSRDDLDNSSSDSALAEQ
jgi:DNA-binding NarL/FixJ family response regulator